jgi:hypothetical protein
MMQKGKDEEAATHAYENQPETFDLRYNLSSKTPKPFLFRALGSLTFGRGSGATV